MKPNAVDYAMLKWVHSNAETLFVLAEQQPGLKGFVESALDALLRLTRQFDVEVLNREFGGREGRFIGLDEAFSKKIRSSVSDLVRALFNSQKTLTDQNQTTILGAEGLGLPGLAYVRKDIYEQEAGQAEDWVEYRVEAEAEVLFAWHENDWTVRRFGRSPYFTVRCTAEPVELQSATLGEQLDWVRSDLTKCYRDIDAIIDDPAKWSVELPVVASSKADAGQLAARFLSSVSKEERALLRSELGAFHERMKTLLSV